MMTHKNEMEGAQDFLRDIEFYCEERKLKRGGTLRTLQNSDVMRHKI